MIGSEVYSAEIKKTEVLMENFRRAIGIGLVIYNQNLCNPEIIDRLFLTGLRVKEIKDVYEGEVTEITPSETENPLGGPH